MISKKRLGIFAFYDKDGIVDRYVTYLLDSICPFISDLVIVCNGELLEEGRKKLEQYSEQLYIRENRGYDAMAVKMALTSYIGWDKVAEYDELVIFNDTFYGPFYSFDEMFVTMDKRQVDFWGLVARITGELGSKNQTFIHSYFYVVGKQLTNSRKWRNYWNLFNSNNWTFLEVLEKYEQKLVQLCEESGCKWDAFLRSDNYVGGRKESSFADIRNISYELIKYHKFPLLKRKSFSIAKDFMRTEADDLRKSLNYIQKTFSYDTSMIWENILRLYNLLDIKQILHLEYVIADSEVNEENTNSLQEEKAIILHLSQLEWVEEQIEYIKQLANDIKILIYPTNFEIEQQIKRCLLEKQKKLIEILPSYNGNLDLITGLNIIKEKVKNYQYICYINDYGMSAEDFTTVNRAYIRTVYGNLIQTKRYIDSISRLFSSNLQLGVLIPPFMYQSHYFGNMGDEWSQYYNECETVLKSGKVHFNLDKEKACISTESAFWCRKDIFLALIELLQGNRNIPCLLGECLGRLVPYIAQSMGYYTGSVMKEETASLQISNMKYLVDTLLNKERKKGNLIKDFFMLEFLGLDSFCKNNKMIYIYGAGQYGNKVADYLEHQNIKFEGFIVSDGQPNPGRNGKYKVYFLSELEVGDFRTGIIVAMWKLRQEAIIQELKCRGYKNIFDI